MRHHSRMQPCSEDFRRKIVEALKKGTSNSEAPGARGDHSPRRERAFFAHRGYRILWLNRYDRRSKKPSEKGL
jgi:hypothetical protein